MNNMEHYEIQYITYVDVDTNDGDNVDNLAEQALIDKIKMYGIENFVREFMEIKNVIV